MAARKTRTCPKCETRYPKIERRCAKCHARRCAIWNATFIKAGVRRKPADRKARLAALEVK